MIIKRKISILILITLFSSIFNFSYAQNVNINASSLVSKTEIGFSPKVGSFVEGSTFEVPILINTKGTSINGIDVKISFDKDKLSIIKPSNNTSIIGVWVEPPKYDNTKGTASYVGVIPNGIVTSSGLIGSITFKAIKTGRAIVSITSDSSVLLNNGMGTEVSFDSIRAEYTIIPKAPEGLEVFSETHPYSSNWYNNDNPVLSWNSESGVEGVSFELDNKPSTIPDNVIDSKETTTSFENLKDGLWYFHIKAYKRGVWGNTSHFLIKIDTAPPADFKPVANYVVAATSFIERTLISFFTTDNLSGIDHYEVGVIDKSQPTTESPVFVQSDSPFQVPIESNSKLEVIVRAIDKAGNVRDSSISVEPPLMITKFIKDYLVYILLFIILAGLSGLIIHYIFGHHIVRHIKEFRKFLKNEESKEDNTHDDFTNNKMIQ